MIIFCLALLISSAAAADPVDCSGVPVGVIVLFPNTVDCSTYFRCDGPVFSFEHCPAGMWFNEIINSCDLQSLTDCKAGHLCLPGVIDYYPDPTDCERYYECYDSDITLHFCPEGLYYNSAQKKCVNPPDSNCGPYTTSPPWTTPDPSSICYGVPASETVLKPYPGDCRRYYICKGLALSEGECPGGYFFDEPRQMCNFPSLVPGCDPDPSTTTASPGPPDDRCELAPTPSYFPDPNDCGGYIECIDGIAYPMSCPGGLYFDSISSLCTIPKNSDCGRTTIDPVTPTGTPSAICPWPPTNPYDTYPYPGDCTKFILCEGGIAHVMDCPDDLWFDSATDECNYPYLSDCPYVH